MFQSPIRYVELPSPRARDVYLTPNNMTSWSPWLPSPVTGAPSRPNHDMTQTGCRPGEARRVEARHFDRAGHCWVFPVAESKGKREKRVVLLTDTAFEICQRQDTEVPGRADLPNVGGKTLDEAGVLIPIVETQQEARL